jgi:hypothetical protein
MRYFFTPLSLFLSLFFSVCNLQGQTSRAIIINGFVFDDRNNNGIKDADEKGIKAATVSDQVNVVTTDDKGFYQLGYTSGYGILFVSVPSGYRAEKSFWQRVDTVNGRSEINFPLVKIASLAAFTFIQASDTHVSEQSLDRMQKFRKIVDSVRPDFVIITGDLVRDALRVPEAEARRLYELFTSEIHKTTLPIWLIPGNHEIFGIERHLSLVSQQNP